jgi:hypothetical protein
MSGGDTTHSFTLVLSGVSEIHQDLADALFEAGCDDTLLGSRDGVVYLDFDREAETFREAVDGAIADVARVRMPVTVARVEPDDLVTASEIARRLGRSRESVRQLVRGSRGPGGFPAPISSVRGSSRIWSFREVVRWFVEIYPRSRTDTALLAHAEYVARRNAELAAERRTPASRG